MKLACASIHYHAAGWPLSRALRDIADAGFAGVEIHLGLRYDAELLAPGAPAREVLEETGLVPVSLFTSLFWTGDASTMSANRAIAEQVLARAQELGVPKVVTATGPWPDDMPRAAARELLLDNLRWLVGAAPDGVTIGLEAVGVPFPHSLWPVHNAETFLEIQAEVGDALKANVDTNNYLRGGDDPAAAVERLGDEIVGVHLKDAQYDRGGWWNVRAGEGVVDFRAFLAALRRVGYDGWIVAEDETWTTTQAHDPGPIARDMHGVYAALLAEVEAA